MPALDVSVMTPRWEEVTALLPVPVDPHPRGCHRPRMADRIVCAKVVQVLVLGCAAERLADHQCSATTWRTRRTRRDEGIRAGVVPQLEASALAGDDRLIGLEVNVIAVDRGSVQAPCGVDAAGRSPLDRGNQGRNRSRAVERRGSPLAVAISAANRHDSALLRPTWGAVRERVPGEADVTIDLDAGYDSAGTRALRDDLGDAGVITPKGPRIAIQATSRWVMERTNAWHQRGVRTLASCTERRIPVIAAFIAFANESIVIRRLRAEAWTRSRWDSRPTRRP
jgi:hypothetical protein